MCTCVCMQLYYMRVYDCVRVSAYTYTHVYMSVCEPCMCVGSVRAPTCLPEQSPLEVPGAVTGVWAGK